jgi:hypothetical protein
VDDLGGRRRSTRTIRDRLELVPVASSTVSPSSTASISWISLSGSTAAPLLAHVVECCDVRSGATKLTPRIRNRWKNDERLRSRNADSAVFA